MTQNNNRARRSNNNYVNSDNYYTVHMRPTVEVPGEFTTRFDVIQFAHTFSSATFNPFRVDDLVHRISQRRTLLHCRLPIPSRFHRRKSRFVSFSSSVLSFRTFRTRLTLSSRRAFRYSRVVFRSFDL